MDGSSVHGQRPTANGESRKTLFKGENNAQWQSKVNGG